MLSAFTRALAQSLPNACTESWERYAATPDASAANASGLHYDWLWDKKAVIETRIYGNGDSIDIHWGANPGQTRLGVVQSSLFALTNDLGTTTNIGCTGDTAYSFINLTGALIALKGDEVCAGSTITFVDQIGAAVSYLWNDTLISDALTIKTTKADTIKFWVRGTNANGCTSSDTATLVVYPVPQFDITVDGKAIKDTMLCGENPIILDAGYADKFYEWSNGELSNSISVLPLDPSSPDSLKYYTVTVGNNFGCETTDSVAIVTCLPPAADNIPMVITPNGDGKNDLWEMPNLTSYPNATVDVYDRWGGIVFKSVGRYKAWDGKYQGKNIPMGTYFYIIQYSKKEKPIYGNLLILR